jgi:hypothetical protein
LALGAVQIRNVRKRSFSGYQARKSKNKQWQTTSMTLGIKYYNGESIAGVFYESLKWSHDYE